MTSFTILNILYLAKDALKYSEGGPDLLSGHLFELGAACRGQIRKLTVCSKLFGLLTSSQNGSKELVETSIMPSDT